MINSTHVRAALWTLCLALLTSLAFALLATVSTQTASAQQSPICEDYPDLPECELPDDGSGENPDADDGENGDGDQGPAGNGDGTGSGDGNLPFTGYPLTPLLLVAVMLLVAALTVRTYLALRRRFDHS